MSLNLAFSEQDKQISGLMEAYRREMDLELET